MIGGNSSSEEHGIDHLGLTLGDDEIWKLGCITVLRLPESG
jgi:hypothetical protein